MKVSKGRLVEIEAVLCQHGSEVEVIVVGSAREEKEKPEGTQIYAYTERLKKRKGIPRYTAREVISLPRVEAAIVIMQDRSLFFACYPVPPRRLRWA